VIAHAGPGGGDRGQVTVELALMIPVILLFALLVVQAGVIARTQLQVSSAAREAVRAAAVSPLDDDARSAAGAVGGLGAGPLQVVVARGELVRVDVRYRAPTDAPLIGRLLPDLDLSAHAVMRSET
jgi:Flp pilus assembly protein TadG